MAVLDKKFILDMADRLGHPSQAALSRAMQMDYQTMNKLLNGAPFRSSTLDKFAQFLSVPCNMLLKD